MGEKVWTGEIERDLDLGTWNVGKMSGLWGNGM